ncbi:hypothetical protein [Streptomyces sp. NPDC056255]|uniref:hypothetical protein n=1 Tax=Streptomyces sp. NPDC056255 TaxID=3345764 RepID=UPI0035D7D9BC
MGPPASERDIQSGVRSQSSESDVPQVEVLVKLHVQNAQVRADSAGEVGILRCRPPGLPGDDTESDQIPVKRLDGGPVPIPCGVTDDLLRLVLPPQTKLPKVCLRGRLQTISRASRKCSSISRKYAYDHTVFASLRSSASDRTHNNTGSTGRIASSSRIGVPEGTDAG